MIWEATRDLQALVAADPMRIPAIYSARTIVADACASISAQAVEIDRNGTPVSVRRRPPLWLLEPSPGYPWSDFVSDAVMSMTAPGSGRAFIEYRQLDREGYPRELEVLDPRLMDVVWNREQTRPRYLYRHPTEPRELFVGLNLLDVRLASEPRSLQTTSPTDALIEAIPGAVHAQRFASRFWQSGAIPTGVISTDIELSESDARAFKDRFLQSVSSARPEPVVLGGGTKYERVSFSMSDAAWIEWSSFFVVEVARAFKLPAPILSATASGASGSALLYQNAGALIQGLIRHGLNPYLVRLEEHLSLLVPRTTRIRFDTNELYRGEFGERYSAYQTALDAGILTLDEVRAAEYLPAMNQPALQETNQP